MKQDIEKSSVYRKRNRGIIRGDKMKKKIIASELSEICPIKIDEIDGDYDLFNDDELARKVAKSVDESIYKLCKCSLELGRPYLVEKPRFSERLGYRVNLLFFKNIKDAKLNCGKQDVLYDFSDKENVETILKEFEDKNEK